MSHFHGKVLVLCLVQMIRLLLSYNILEADLKHGHRKHNDRLNKALFLVPIAPQRMINGRLRRCVVLNLGAGDSIAL